MKVRNFQHLLIFLLVSQSVFASLLGKDHKEVNYEFVNKVYADEIKSVQTLTNGTISSIPILTLKSNDIMLLQFDDLLEDEDKNYYYKVIHCDRNWEASNITEVEYIEGYNDDMLRNWEFSIGTKVNYTHYWLQIPNRDTKLKISGNYLLLIYDKNNESKPILTRRFLVAESKVLPFVAITRPMDVTSMRYNHQMSLSLNLGNNKYVNPQRDVYVDIVQNGSWGQSYHELKPVFISNNVLTFDNFGAISFKALSEYRSFDTRRLQSRGRNVKSVDLRKSPTEVKLREDIPRPFSTYSFTYDFNGNYYIDTWDYTNPQINDFLANASFFDDSVRQTFITRNELLDGEYQVNEKDLRADYGEVVFTLKTNEIYDYDVYVYGGLSNWMLNPDYKMTYSFAEGLYKTTVLLKQGYYDYMYGAVNQRNESVDFTKVEGSWMETENEYTTLVYLSEFGGRYDRIIGYSTVKSR